MPGSISGRITTPEGVPLSGVPVQAVGSCPNRAVTNSQGNYLISNLCAGTYAVSVASTAGVFAPATLSVTLQQSQNLTCVNFSRSA
ncbi:MAG TPA: carboxypeptidase-like regulatory domain-containing protein [Pyrinomonadaceae bacterium]|jgi:hypothetical protein